MPAPSGISAQIGYADETVIGEAATPTLFLPFLGDGLTDDRPPLESEGIIAGQVIIGDDQWNGGEITVAGDTQHELYTAGIVKLIKAMMGSLITTGPTSGIYEHTATVGPLDDTTTIQVGLPDTSGVVHPKTVSGAKVGSWEIACAAGEIATIGLDWVATTMEVGTRTVADGVTATTSKTLTSATAAFSPADEDLTVIATGIPAGTRIARWISATEVELTKAATATATGVSVRIGLALAAATYTTAKPFKFNHASVLVDDDELDVTSATIAGDNALADSRRRLGHRRAKVALENDLRVYDGSLETEFESLVQYRRFTSGDSFPLVLDFTAGAASFTITANVRYDGETTTVSGREILTANLPFKVTVPSGGTMADAISIVVRSTDATA